MADIFISYSSKDREQAEQLIEMLTSAGLSIWIDQAGIDVSASWSKEIVQAINECKAFVVLLSSSSLNSPNVIKEVSLASEKRKKILPLELEPVQLNEDLEYQLAGIQRASMSNIDAVIRALAKLGLDAIQPPTLSFIKERDARKSLMILPFEDLSPTGDNAWFADGIVSELITALTKVKALRVADAATTKEYKAYKGHLVNYAREMNVRYFVQGDVRKFGDSIKITSRLLDIETGDHLWSDSLKGTMADIFQIQEEVAEQVVNALKVHLDAAERAKMGQHGTKHHEAYELVLKAREYFRRQTKEGLMLSSQLADEAIRIDPEYAEAYQHKANSIVAMCQTYRMDDSLLDEAEALCYEVLRLGPSDHSVYLPLSMLLELRGRTAEAESAAREYVRKAPEDFLSHFALAFFLDGQDRQREAAHEYEECLRYQPDYLPALWNLVAGAINAGELEQAKLWAPRALAHYERQLRLLPEDEHLKVCRANLLYQSGRVVEARTAAKALLQLKDGRSLLNAVGLLLQLSEPLAAIDCLERALDAGSSNRSLFESLLVEAIRLDPHTGDLPEFQRVQRRIQEAFHETDDADHG